MLIIENPFQCLAASSAICNHKMLFATRHR